MNKFLRQKNNKGFTLLFAVLVSTMIISISATVISIALRQTIISGTTRESQYAFYAANTILECAFYWDVVGVPTTGPGVVFPAPSETPLDAGDTADITCGRGNITTGAGYNSPFTKPWDTSISDETTIYMELDDVDGGFGKSVCAEATITKLESGGIITTIISAKGYNTCDLTSPRAVERGLIQSYQS